MNKQIGKASLGWLCILAAGLWVAYKHEYFRLLLSAWSGGGGGEFDKAAETRLLLFILSPAIVLFVVGFALLMRSLIRGGKPRQPANSLPIV